MANGSAAPLAAVARRPSESLPPHDPHPEGEGPVPRQPPRVVAQAAPRAAAVAASARRHVADPVGRGAHEGALGVAADEEIVMAVDDAMGELRLLVRQGEGAQLRGERRAVGAAHHVLVPLPERQSELGLLRRGAERAARTSGRSPHLPAGCPPAPWPRRCGGGLCLRLCRNGLHGKRALRMGALSRFCRITACRGPLVRKLPLQRGRGSIAPPHSSLCPPIGTPVWAVLQGRSPRLRLRSCEAGPAGWTWRI